MAKGMMIIDGQRVSFDGEKNVLSVIRKAGIEMPTFCYYSDLSVYGACRMCVVENEETGKIDASCSMEPRNGMRIRTNSARLLKHRRMILELLLASHNCNCTTCEKSGHCHLQTLAQQFGVRRIRFEDTRERYEIDNTSPAVLRDPNKCILCGDCVRVCEEMQGMGILNFAYRGSSAQVMPAFDRKMAQTKCVSCGQCAAVCPTGAITVKNQIGEAWRAIHDPKKRVVIQIAPAGRVAVGEAFGIPACENVLDKLVTALKLMGVDEVYDTTFGADFTTIAESEEFLERLKNGGPFPMFTSCCPAWVKYLENENPKYLKNISTCKSPMEMVGAIFRDKYAEKDAQDGRTTYHIAIMPCTAKKMEAARPEFIHDGRPDVDLVLTTHEVIDMMQETGIQLNELELESPDLPFGLGSGAAVIYGTTGGVAEAVMKMSFGNEIGFAAENTVLDWFAPMPGAIVAELSDEVSDAVRIGVTTAEKAIALGADSASIEELAALNAAVLEAVYPTKTRDSGTVESFSHETKTRVAPAVKQARPKALIPVFPGTNCEYDTQRALSEAGAAAEQFIVRNLTSADVADSVERFAATVRTAQMIVIPGGFSGGDEPDGSAKFIASFFRSPAVTEAVRDLLQHRDGLMLGICNGFQALIKLGLAAYGDIRPITAYDPTLTFNTIGRHQSMLVRTRVASTGSPWLSHCDAGSEYEIAISHGEGRFVAPQNVLDQLVANGQVATQYVDLEGEPTMDQRYNPNGSLLAIEGITSPDGRVFGKMGHSERSGEYLYKNVTGDKYQPIFEGGVDYFKV